MGPDGRGRAQQVAGAEVGAVVGERLAGPVQPHRLDGLVEQGVALVEVDAEGVELALQVAGAHPEHEAAPGDDVEGGGGLGGQERVPVGEHGQVGEQGDALGDGRGRAEGHERVEGLVATALGQPAPARGRGARCRRGRPTPPPRGPGRPPWGRRWPAGRCRRRWAPGAAAGTSPVSLRGSCGEPLARMAVLLPGARTRRRPARAGRGSCLECARRDLNPHILSDTGT